MQTCYIDEAHRGIADLVKPGELTPFWTITRINIPSVHRGKGFGSLMLKRILTDANVEGVTLALEIFSSGPLDYSQLQAWYERHGFTMSRLGYMVRRPVAQ